MRSELRHAGGVSPPGRKAAPQAAPYPPRAQLSRGPAVQCASTQQGRGLTKGRRILTTACDKSVMARCAAGDELWHQQTKHLEQIDEAIMPCNSLRKQRLVSPKGGSCM